MQAINNEELIKNRDWLIAWQKEQRDRKIDGIRLNLGSGRVKVPNYTNVDPYTEESDSKDDMRYLPSFEPNTVAEIATHHAIEHVAVREVLPMLQRWYELLILGGTLEAGLPDIELTMQRFLEASDDMRWGRWIWCLYGQQARNEDLYDRGEWDTRENLPFLPGQEHKSGWSLGYFTRLLEDVGFKMINAFWYDSFGSPSFFIYAMKPETQESKNTLEDNCVIGTFSHRTTYISDLWKSAQKYLPDVQFITRFNRGSIVDGMTLLRDDFIKSKKRYWVFLDDDVIFLNSSIIKDALKTLITGGYGAVTTYMTFNKDSLTAPYNPNDKRLITKTIPWSVGYFIMIDSEKIGNIIPDANLPNKNISVDVSYSLEIRKIGYEIGISSNYLFHLLKNEPHDTEGWKITQEYMKNKYGDFYKNTITPISVAI